MTESGKQSAPASIDRRPTIMTLEEVAKYLRVHKSTVYRMAREGTIPSTKVANQWRFKKARIDEWLLEREDEDGFED
jgi:excisionase family DNA binding protein